jgi:serine/threonine protein kinase
LRWNGKTKVYDEKMTGRQKMTQIIQFLKGIEFLFKDEIFHRDLKLENIFVKYNEETNEILFKIGDFGFIK